MALRDVVHTSEDTPMIDTDNNSRNNNKDKRDKGILVVVVFFPCFWFTPWLTNDYNSRHESGIKATMTW